MREVYAEVVTIGEEILIGQIVNSNAAYIGERLRSVGVRIIRNTTIGDSILEITKALSEAEARARIIIITGGLGPTKDDCTKQALCRYFNTKLVFSDEAFQNIENIFSVRKFQMNELNRQQAELPENCIFIRNKIGTASGMGFEKEGRLFVSMPGVPFEMKQMLDEEVIPIIKHKFELPVVVQRTINTQGLYEGLLAEKLENWETRLNEAGFELAWLPSHGIIRLRITGSGASQNELESRINEFVEELYREIGDHIFSIGNKTMAEVLGEELLKRKMVVSVAESCTGGTIGSMLVSVPGSSSYFNGGVIAYSNEIKNKVLGVDNDILEKHGAVSKEVVELMVKGVLKNFGTDLAIAVSGIAGPDGGTEDKPVGTVWIAVGSKEKVIAEKFNLGSQRDRNIMRSALTAMNMLRVFLIKK